MVFSWRRPVHLYIVLKDTHLSSPRFFFFFSWHWFGIKITPKRDLCFMLYYVLRILKQPIGTFSSVSILFVRVWRCSYISTFLCSFPGELNHRLVWVDLHAPLKSISKRCTTRVVDAGSVVDAVQSWESEVAPQNVSYFVPSSLAAERRSTRNFNELLLSAVLSSVLSLNSIASRSLSRH